MLFCVYFGVNSVTAEIGQN